VVVHQLVKKFLANCGTGNLLFTTTFSTNSVTLHTPLILFQIAKLRVPILYMDICQVLYKNSV